MTSSTLSSIIPGMDTQTKVRENRLRHMAERQGLILRKSRRRDPRALDYGRYDLDVEGGAASQPGRAAPDVPWRTGWSLDEVERYLTGEGRE